MSSLSVVMTSYNYAHYLPNALDAILKQSFPPLEIIIIDDASTDESVKIIKEYQEKYPIIKLFQNPQNLGVIATANRAIDLAQGDYLAICSADDEVLPGFFEKTMYLLQQHPHAAICSSIFSVFYNHDPSKIRSYSSLLSRQNAYFSPDKLTKIMMKKDCRLGGQNTIYRRKAVLEAGKLLPQLGPMCDWFMIFVLGFRHGACFIPESLTKMRIHPSAYSQCSEIDLRFSKMFVKEIEELLAKEFQDIRPYFLRSGIIYQIGLRVFPILFLEKKNWKFLNPASLFHFGVIFLKSIKSKILS